MSIERVEVAELTLWALNEYCKAASSLDRNSNIVRELAENPDGTWSGAWVALMVSGIVEAHCTQLSASDCPAMELSKHSTAISCGEIVPWIEVNAIAPYSVNMVLLKDFIRNAPLNAQSKAEIAMALLGQKFSRIHLRGSEILDITDDLQCRALVSSRRIVASYDASLDGFSNEASWSTDIERFSPEGEYYAYFGGTFSEQCLVHTLDLNDLAGSCLGIPRCCRNYFRQNWQRALMEFAGDVAFLKIAEVISAGTASIETPWQCNPYGMYAGSGLLWHFPCGFDCSSTVELVNDRFQQLNHIDPSFAAELKQSQSEPVWVRRDRSFSSSELTDSLGIKPY